MPIILFLGNEKETDEVLYYVSKIIWCQNGIDIENWYCRKTFWLEHAYYNRNNLNLFNESHLDLNHWNNIFISYVYLSINASIKWKQDGNNIDVGKLLIGFKLKLKAVLSKVLHNIWFTRLVFIRLLNFVNCYVSIYLCTHNGSLKAC